MSNVSLPQLVIAGIALALGFFTVFLWPSRVSENAADAVSASAACANISPDLSLMANAAYAVDLQSGEILYGKNANAQLPLASLTKLMTVAIASEALSADDVVTISKEALAPDGDAGFRIGEQWKTGDLVGYTLMMSANDGAHALALATAAKKNEDLDAFVASMNEKARALGMHETFFENDTGLDISSTTASAYGSARDIATLLASLVQTVPALVEDTSVEQKIFTSLSGYAHKARNTSSVPGALDGTIASKTGYTDLAGGNLAVVFEPIPGRPVAAVVLGSTRDGRDADMEKLADGSKMALKRAIVCGDGSQSP